MNSLLVKLEAMESGLRHEHYCVYFLFRHYIETCIDRQPKRRIVQLFHILNLQQCIAISRIIDDNSEALISCQIEVLSQFSRIFEHTSVNLDTLYSIYANAQMIATDFCLLL